MIIDYNFLCVIKIFDWISFAIRWMFYSTNLVLKMFVEWFIYQTWVYYVLNVIFLLVFDDYRQRWWNDLIEHKILKIFSKQWDVKYRMNVHLFRKFEFIRAASFFQNFEETHHLMIEFSWWSVNLNVSYWQSHLIIDLIVWCKCFMSVNVRDLMLLIFFHMFFSEFSNIFHNKHYFSVSESIDSFFNCVFIKVDLIEIYFWFEFIISEKREHLSDDWNEDIKCVFYHWQSICSIVLLMIDVSTQIAFHFLIWNLALFVRFRVKCDE
jgi:hypothetical protein